MGVARYLGKRAIFLGVTFLVATYGVVVIANMGGLIDKFLIGQIQIEVAQSLASDREFLRDCSGGVNSTCWRENFTRLVNEQIEARDLDEPFIRKSFRQTFDAITLQLGDAQRLRAASNSQALWDIILERLPNTILLFTTATVLSAVLGIWLGLRMARRALSPMDRGLTVVSITTFVVPSWIFGILFLLIFWSALRLVPSGGMVSAPAPTDPFLLGLDFGYHLLLPVATVTFSSFGSWSYVTRNLVLQIMDEDYITAARSKGLPEKVVLNKHVLRAASPPIVTSLALALIASWTGAIITELIFQWPGLGLLYFQAIILTDAPVIIGLTVVYAFLFVVTIFALEAIYSFLDPRIRARGR